MNLTDFYHTVPQSDNPSTQMPRRRRIAASRILRLPHRGHSCPIHRLGAAKRLRHAVTGDIIGRYASVVRPPGDAVAPSGDIAGRHAAVAPQSGTSPPIPSPLPRVSSAQLDNPCAPFEKRTCPRRDARASWTVFGPQECDCVEPRAVLSSRVDTVSHESRSIPRGTIYAYVCGRRETSQFRRTEPDAVSRAKDVSMRVQLRRRLVMAERVREFLRFPNMD